MPKIYFYFVDMKLGVELAKVYSRHKNKAYFAMYSKSRWAH